MRTGIIGTGRIGSTLARILVAAGHEVLLANARGPKSIGPLLAELGPAASAAHPAEVADRAELLVLMVPYASIQGLFPTAAVQDKVLVDATNAFGGAGAPADLGDRSSSELVAEWYPGARVVKSLNTMHFETLAVAGGTSRAKPRGAPRGRTPGPFHGGRRREGKGNRRGSHHGSGIRPRRHRLAALRRNSPAARRAPFQPAAHGSAGAGMDISLNVNGRPEQFSAEPNELLVERLRDGLGLTGTKVGCDTGQCGTCVVRLDGRSVKSCLILTASAAAPG